MRKLEIKKFVRKYYKNKDTMHDLTHVERVLRRAKELTKNVPHDGSILEIAAYLHGLVYSNEKEIRNFLKHQKINPSMIENITKVAEESQKESMPETIEGKMLHDAHLLEGDDYFLITKCLVTGSLRGQSLRETVEYMKKNVVGKLKCCFPQHQRILRKRERLARKFLESIKREI